jgi:general stress protein 26
MMKITGAMGNAYTMTEKKVERFLEGKLNLQLASVDEMGDPNIQPVWFEYDKDKKRLFIMTPKASKKDQNIRRRSNIYFSIDDDENFPYKGVKGKGEAITLVRQKGNHVASRESKYEISRHT